jgi:hypothetical protein
MVPPSRFDVAGHSRGGVIGVQRNQLFHLQRNLLGWAVFETGPISVVHAIRPFLVVASEQLAFD